MGVISQQGLKGWGTRFMVVILFAIFSSCSENKKAEQELTDPNDITFNGRCFVPGPNINISQIVNGQKVTKYEKESKNAVMLITNIETEDGVTTSFCTATPVSKKILITAAHCVKNAKSVNVVFHHSIYCQDGYELEKHTTRVESVIIHPDYIEAEKISNEFEQNYDLALIKLDNEIPQDYRVFKISAQNPAPNQPITLYGFGVTGTGKKDFGVLRKTKISPYDYQLGSYNVVFKQQNKTGICQGDSGGSSFINIDQEEMIYSVNSLVFNNNDRSEDLCNRKGLGVILWPQREWIDSAFEKLNNSQ